MIKKRMDTDESRLFWKCFPKYDKSIEETPLPFIGEDWWNAEKELSPNLLSEK